MLTNEELIPLLETKTNVYGSEGEKIGTLGQVYLDDGTGLPHFATVRSGLFGSFDSFVPLEEAEISNGQLYVRFTKEFVKDAPSIDPTGRLGPEEEHALYEYYSQAGLGANRDPGPAGLHGGPAPDPLDRDAPPSADGPGHSFDGGAARPRMRKYVADPEGPNTHGTRGGAEPRDEIEALAEGERMVMEEGPVTKRPRMDP